MLMVSGDFSQLESEQNEEQNSAAEFAGLNRVARFLDFVRDSQ